MTKSKKEFWLRQNDNHLTFRLWDADSQEFYAAGELEYHNDENVALVYPNDMVLQQCTGCEDKNGRMIFEGDILETNESGWRGVVIYCDGQFALEDTAGGFSRWPDWEECKVIGNVYQNPELIP